MPGIDVEQLNIQLKSDATDAVSAIDNLIGTLERLNKTDLSGASTSFGQLAKMADSISKIGGANTGNIAATGKAVGALASQVRGVDFGDLSQLQVLGTAIGKLHTAGRNGQSVVAVGQSVKILADYLRDIQGYGNIAAVTELSTSVGKLANAGKNGQNIVIAGQSMKLLADSMQDVNVAPEVLQTLAQLAAVFTSISSKTGKRYSDDFFALASGLERLFQVLARAPTVGDDKIRLLEVLSTLDTESVKAARGMLRLGDSADRASKGVDRYANSTQRGAINTQSLFSRIAFTIARFRQIYFAIKRIASFLGKMVESSMDYVEVLNYFNAAFQQVASRSRDVFGNAGEEAGREFTNRFASEAAELTEKMSGYAVSATGMVTNTMGTTLGMNPAQMMNYQAVFAQMASSMGVSSDMATDLSRALTEIGADLASVRNMDYESTWKNLQSGLVGMSRAVDKFGLNIRNVNLQQELTRLGLSANIQTLNQSDKALLRTIIILENSQYAWGDLADTLQQPANQMRMLRAGFQNLSRTVGNLFLPIVTAALPYINAFVIALQKLFEMLINLIGIDFDWGSTMGAAEINSDWADYLEEEAAGFEDAAEAAKEYKNQLLGFDEINKLGSNDGGTNKSAGGSAGNPLLTGSLEAALRDALDRYQRVWDESYSRVSGRINEIAGSILSWVSQINEKLTPTTTALKNLWNEVLVPLGQWTWGAIGDFYHEFLVPVAEWVIGEGIPRLVDLFIKFYNDINWEQLRNALSKVWVALKPFMIGTFEGVIAFFEAVEPVATLAFNGLIEVLNVIGEFLKNTDPETLELLGMILGVSIAGGAVTKVGSKMLPWMLAGKTMLPKGSVPASTGANPATGVLPTVLTSVSSAARAVMWTILGLEVGDIASELISESGKGANGGQGREGGSLFWEWLGKLGSGMASGAGAGAAGGAPFGIAGITAIAGGLAGLFKQMATARDSRGNKLNHYTAPYLSWLKPIIYPEKYLFKPIENGSEKVEEKLSEELVGKYGGRGHSGKFYEYGEALRKAATQEVDEFGNAVKKEITYSSAAIDGVMDLSHRSAKTKVSEAWQAIAKTARTKLSEENPRLSKFLGDMKTTFSGTMGTMGKDLKDSFNAWFGKVPEDTKSAISGIGKALDAAVENAKSDKSSAKKLGTETRNAYKAGLAGMDTDAEKQGQAAVDKLKTAFNYETVKEAASGAKKAIIDTYKEGFNGAIAAYNEMANNMNNSSMNGQKPWNMTMVPQVMANGGMVEDGFFFANSNELIGGFSNGRTAVANNAMIIEGIEGGVERAMGRVMMSAMSARSGANGAVEVVFNVDSETLYRATLRGQQRYNNRYHVSMA